MLSPNEKEALRRLSLNAGINVLFLEVLERHPRLTLGTPSEFAKLAGVGVSQERAAHKFLIAAEVCGLYQLDASGTMLASDKASLERIRAGLCGICLYVDEIHQDKSLAQIVVTRPPEPCLLSEKLKSRGWHVAVDNTEGSFRRLASHATKRFVIMTPFLDETGASWIKSIFGMTRANVTKILILRYVNEPGRNGFPTGLLGIKQWLRAEAIQVFDYCIPRHPYSSARETFHAKVVLSDFSLAYVGSANLNSASIEHSMEMGVEVSGSAASDVALVVNAVLESATQIDI